MIPQGARPRILAQGQLPTSSAALYTAPTPNTGAVITYVAIYNTSALTIQAVAISVKQSGQTARQVYANALATLTSSTPLGGSGTSGTIMLGPGDAIYGSTTTDSTADYIVCGFEIPGT